MSQLNAPEAGSNEIKLEYKCPLLWQSLEKTDDEKIRYCHTCEKKVTFIESRDELYQAAYTGSCGFFMGKGDAFLKVKEADEQKTEERFGKVPEVPLDGVFVMPAPPLPSENFPPKKHLILTVKDKIFGLFFRQ